MRTELRRNIEVDVYSLNHYGWLVKNGWHYIDGLLVPGSRDDNVHLHFIVMHIY